MVCQRVRLGRRRLVPALRADCPASGHTPVVRPPTVLCSTRSHLITLSMLRIEWEHESPLLICGFDITRETADALLFRRPKVGRPAVDRGCQLAASCRPSPAAAGWLWFPVLCSYKLLGKDPAMQHAVCNAGRMARHARASKRSICCCCLHLPQGTCLVRLGQEVGGVIVSLRPDKPSLAG